MLNAQTSSLRANVPLLLGCVSRERLPQRVPMPIEVAADVANEGQAKPAPTPPEQDDPDALRLFEYYESAEPPAVIEPKVAVASTA